MRKILLSIIDPFFPIFKRFLNLQTYRYAVCGASNTAFDICLYFIFYNYVLNKELLHFPFLAVSPHIAAFFMAFIISFPSGFFLMRTVVFPNSSIGGKVQVFRYFSVVLLNIFLNYFLLKIFVEIFEFYPTPSKVVITGIIVTVTYLLQKHFTFKESKAIIVDEKESIKS